MNAPLGSLQSALPVSLANLFQGIADEPTETVVLAYLDPYWRLLGVRHARGGRGMVPLVVRDVVRDMLSFDARWLVMAHNHPSGDHRPSQTDLTLTRRLVHGLDAIGARVFDHLVLGGGRMTSLRTEGLV